MRVNFTRVDAAVAARKRRSSSAPAEAECRYHACWHQYAYPFQSVAGEQRVEAAELQQLLAAGAASLLALAFLFVCRVRRQHFY